MFVEQKSSSWTLCFNMNSFSKIHSKKKKKPARSFKHLTFVWNVLLPGLNTHDHAMALELSFQDKNWGRHDTEQHY